LFNSNPHADKSWMPDSLALAIGELLRAQHRKLALAESCTGGLIASFITDVPGSSEYFLGGVVAYAYEAKELLLDVPHDLLLENGAVSEPVTRVLAEHARKKFQSDIAVGITGIMGPGGATATKPLGLTYIALSANDASIIRRFVWTGNRSENKISSAHAALEILHEYLTRT
jgi:nicotinamide-nucleotide amidase